MHALRKLAALGLAASSVLALAHGALADYPTKPISIVVPYSPGGTNDVVVRLVANKLGTALGQNVIVENQPGASGNIGAVSVSRADPDGYTLLLITMGHSIAPSMYTDLGYDLTRDLVPVAELSRGPMLVMTNPNVEATTFPELVELAKSKPGEMLYASAGNGSSTHLTTELLDHYAGIEMTHIPYNGSAPAMTDTMAGNADVVLDLMFSAMPQVESGSLRALAITGKERSPLLPDVATVAEAGIAGLEDFDAEVWNGLVAPAGTPQPVIDRLNEEINKALADPEIAARLEGQGFNPVQAAPEEFGELIASEIARWGEVVRIAGATVN